MKLTKKKLITILNKKKGLYQHGNKLRVQIHADPFTALFLSEIGKKRLNAYLDEMIKPLRESLLYDEDNEWVYDAKNILFMLAEKYPMMIAEEAIERNLAFSSIDGLPFIIVTSQIDEKLFYRIPATLYPDKLIVGSGPYSIITHKKLPEPLLWFIEKENITYLI